MKSLLTLTKDLLFPRFCVGCGFLGSYICLSCEKKLPYATRDTCVYCHKASPFGLTHPVCLRPAGVDGLAAVFFYNYLLKRIVHAIKYRLSREVFDELMHIAYLSMAAKLSEQAKLEKNLVVVPIPLHEKRLKKRGFNQAELIADFISGLIQSPKVLALTRIKDTLSQTGFNNGLDRYRNTRGAFAVFNTDDVAGKSILLVDDVVTTGATVKAATAALKKAGAQKVYVFTLAKG